MTCRHALPGGVSNCRVLGLVLSPRFGGEVVIDGFGIVPVPMTPEEARDSKRITSFRAVNFRAVRDGPSQKRFLEWHLARYVRRYRPTVAVIGSTGPTSRNFRTSFLVAKHILEDRGVEVVERSITYARKFLLGSLRGKRRDSLKESLVKNFFPHPISGYAGKQKQRYERHAWNALALALVTLAEHRPLSALALVQSKARFPEGFSRLLARAAYSL